MKATKALQVILWISIVGVLFSGYLSYNELFVGSCGTKLLIRCGTFRLADLPACVYGLIMYLGVLTISAIGLSNSRVDSKRAKKLQYR